MQPINYYYTLHTGAKVPLIGLGTSGINGPDIMLNVLNDALQMGYRLIDTASVYENEKDIGYALDRLIPKFNLKRSDIFITTKLDPVRSMEASSEITQSIKNLNCGYLDLYLKEWCEVTGDKDRRYTWDRMVHAVRRKRVRHIGLNNYTLERVNYMLSHNPDIKPAALQVEFHPFCRDRKLLEVCRENNIFVQGYGTLGGGMWKNLTSHQTVVKIANSLGKTPAQILLRWALQQKVGVIPKSQDRGHLFSNIQLGFTIPDEDMITLSTLSAQTRYDREGRLARSWVHLSNRSEKF